MANFGLSRPWIAELDTETGKYSNGFRLDEAISTSVSPEYAEGSLYSDNSESEYVKEFTGANVTAGTRSLPVKAKTVVFGHRLNEDGDEISNADDNGKYVGYGFISRERLNGRNIYMACILLKVKFNEGEESFETKGNSITFKTPSISGRANTIGISYGNVKKDDWRIKSPFFDTEEEAEAWIKTKFDVEEQCEKPKASVTGGTYPTAQSVALSTVTAGAKIKYTTNGTTPSDTNGTEYKSPIPVPETMVIKAIAYKSGALTSEVLTEEYFITTE